MAGRIRRVEYYYATARDRPGEAYQLLAQLASAEVDLLAFSAIPIGPTHTQLILFPASVEHLAAASRKIGITLDGPQHAFLVQGDDQLGALADIHRRLFDAQVNVYASHGVTDGVGGFGYLLYVRPETYEDAARVLGV